MLYKPCLYIPKVVLFIVFSIFFIPQSYLYAAEISSTPLSKACSSKNYTMLSLLINKGARIDRLDIGELLNCANVNSPKILSYVKKKIASQKGLIRNVNSLWGMYSGCDNLPVDYKGDIPSYYKSLQVRAFDIFSLGIHPDSTDEKGRTALLLAASACPKEFISKLVKLGANIHVENEKGLTPLHLAAGWNSLDVVKLLLINHADVNHPDRQGEIALHHAARSNIDEVVNVLLEKTRNVNEVNINGMSPLMLASESNDINIIKILIKSGANTNLLDYDNNSALLFATRNNNTSAIFELINAGAEVDISNKYNNTPIDHAVTFKNTKVVDLMIKNSTVDVTDIKLSWEEALNTANVEAVKLWLTNNPDLKIRNNKGEQIVYWKSVLPNNNLLELLIDAGADTSIKSSSATPLLMRYLDQPITKQVQNRTYFTIRDTLVKKITASSPGLINYADAEGQTALMKFIKRYTDFRNTSNYRSEKIINNVKYIIEVLVENGADINHIDNYKKTPLTLIPLEYTGFMLEQGAKVDITGKVNISALHDLLKYTTKGNLRFNALYHYISAGADLNVRDTSGVTPLMMAVESKSIYMVKPLVDAGADVNFRDVNNKTAWHRAIGLEDSEILLSILAKKPEMNAEEQLNIEQYLLSPVHKLYGSGTNLDFLDLVLINDSNKGANLTALLSNYSHLYTKERLNKSLFFMVTQNKRYLDVINLLVKYGADINAVNADGFTPLTLLMTKSNFDLIELFLKAGADTSVIDGNNVSPMSSFTVKRAINKIKDEEFKETSECPKSINNGQGFRSLGKSGVYDVLNNIVWSNCPHGMVDQGNVCNGTARLYLYSHSKNVIQSANSPKNYGWRLPTSKELLRMYTNKCNNKLLSIDSKIFTGIPVTGYWLNNRESEYIPQGVFFDFHSGRPFSHKYSTRHASLTALQPIWLVRDALDVSAGSDK